MSSARPEKQLGLPEKTWKPVEEFIQKTGQKDIDIHCHMPICIGYKGSINGNQLVAAIRSVVEKEGYDYTVYLAPKDEASLNEWLKENAEALKMIPPDRIININDWRKGNAWKQASESYAAYMKKPEREMAVNNVIKTDIENFTKRNKQVDESESRQHVISEVTDVVSWMTPKSQGANKLAVVMMYGHRFTQAMQNAKQNADEMGYVQDTIVGVKYKPGLIEVTNTHQHQNMKEQPPRVHTLFEARPPIESNTSGPEAGSSPPRHDTLAIYYLLDKVAESQNPSFVASVIRNLGNGHYAASQDVRHQASYSGSNANIVRVDVPLNQSGPGQVVQIDAISRQDSQLRPRPRRRQQQQPSSFASQSVMFPPSRSRRDSHANGAVGMPVPGRRPSDHH